MIGFEPDAESSPAPSQGPSREGEETSPGFDGTLPGAWCLNAGDERLKHLSEKLALIALDPGAFLEHMRALPDAAPGPRSLPAERLELAIRDGLTVLTADEIELVLYEDYPALQALRKAMMNLFDGGDVG